MQWMSLMRFFAAFLLTAPCSARIGGGRGNEVEAQAIRSRDLPMTEALRLLEAMRSDLEKEAKAEEDTYKSLSCWCDKNKQEKSDAVDAARGHIDQLEATMEASSGDTGSLGATIEELKKQIADGERSLAEAETFRKKEAAEFHSEETDILQSIQLLRGAITALEKHHPSMLQGGGKSETLRKMLPSLRHLVHAHLSRLDDFLSGISKQEKESLLKFMEAEPDLLEADGLSKAPAFVQQLSRSGSSMSLRSSLPYQSYASQSGQVMGVLRQMKETFEADLPAVQKAELAKQTAFAELKGSKEAEINELKATLAAKSDDLADAKERLAVAKEALEDTKESMSADQKFLQEMVVTCVAGDKEWERRSKLRADEIAAVSEAIAILSTDSVKDAQQTTFGFLQTSSQSRGAISITRHGMEAMQRARAIAVLQRTLAQAPLLTALLESAKTDPFAKVLEAIDALAQRLKQEQADEVKHRDYCLGELHENEVESSRIDAKLASLQAKIDSLSEHSKVLSAEVRELKDQTSELQVQQQRASEDRQAESAEFQRTVNEQRRARSALERAHARLADFYMTKTVSLAQASRRNTTAEAPQFKEYKKHESSHKILGMLQKLAGDARLLEEESIHGEQTAQAAYETLVAETNDSIKAKARLIADKSEELASLDEEKLQTNTEHSDATSVRTSLLEAEAAVHKACDFILANFATRQEARASEVDALAEVKAILNGMSRSSS